MPSKVFARPPKEDEVLFMVARLIAVESAIQKLRTSKTAYHRKTVPFLENHIEQHSAEISSVFHLVSAMVRVGAQQTEEAAQHYNETLPAVLAHSEVWQREKG